MKKKFKKFLRNFWLVLNKPEILILPGNLAFFFILSVVPILTLISYAAFSLNLSMSFITEFLTSAFGNDISSLIIPNVSIDHISLSFFLTLIVGYYTASKGASSIIITSNTIYNVPDKGYIYRKIKALIMTFFIVILFMFILVVPLFGTKIISLINMVNMDSNIAMKIEMIFKTLQGPISWLVIFMLIKILYTMAPDRKVPSKDVNYGALFTSVGWIVATAIYSYYISNYAHYSTIYGGLANLVILLLWFYLLAYIFVVGIALNCREEASKLQDTTRIKIIKTDNLKK